MLQLQETLPTGINNGSDTKCFSKTTFGWMSIASHQMEEKWQVNWDDEVVGRMLLFLVIVLEENLL